MAYLSQRSSEYSTLESTCVDFCYDLAFHEKSQVTGPLFQVCQIQLNFKKPYI